MEFLELTWALVLIKSKQVMAECVKEQEMAPPKKE